MRLISSIWLGCCLISSLAMYAQSSSPSGSTQSATKSAPTSAAAKFIGTAVPKPPQTKVKMVEEVIHGVKIDDPYRWLEDSSSPETKEFVSQQLAYTRRVLDPLPGRDKIRARVEQLVTIGSIGTPRIGGNYYFYTRREGTQNQPVLYVRQGLNGKDNVLVDVNKLASDGTVALDWWRPSRDGKYVAYGTSPSGSENSTLHVIETSNGKLLPDTIVRTRAASIAWKPDSSGFFYTRYPRDGEVPKGQDVYYRKVFYHPLGADPAKDQLIFGEGRDPQEWANVKLSEDGRWLLIMAEQGWAKSELYVKDVKANVPSVPVATGKDFLYDGEVFGNTIYILTNEGAPRFRLFAVNAAQPARKNWKEIIPQTDAVLKNVQVIGRKLFAQYEKNAASQLRTFALDGKPLSEIKLPQLGSIIGVGGEWDSKEAFYGFHSYTVPPTIYHYDPASGISSIWGKVDAPIDPSLYEVKQLWFNSKDGTRVPMFVVAKKGLVLNGKNPTLLTGYGGFNSSETPAFARSAYLWLEHGGVYAVANLRGGSEFGEDWHRAGMLEKKQNVFDDFIAAAEFLIAKKYTDTSHLVVQGGSNGGLLMGAALTQRPDLFRAVVCKVPLLDMIRYQNFQIARLWIPEYGSSENPEQFKWLYAYSPYHHVKNGTVYPAVLFMTADTDTRVDPMHAKKMAARLQAANGGNRPILLRIETKAGHGAGKPISKLIEEGTDIWSFLFWQLGMTP